MQPMSGNILDQLLGVAEVNPKNQFGKLANDQLSDQPEAIFGELFGSLLSGEVTADPTNAQIKTEINPDELISLNSQMVELLPADNHREMQTIKPRIASDISEVSKLNLQQRVESILNQPANSISNEDNLHLQFPQLIDSNNGVTAFEIIESNIENDKLHLTVQGNGFNSKVEVSLPLESLTEDQLPLNNNSLKQMPNMLSQRLLINEKLTKPLETLLSDLDLKQIEIDSVDQKNIQKQAEPQLQIQLAGVKDGRPVILTGQVATGMVKINKVSQTRESDGGLSTDKNPSDIITDKSDNQPINQPHMVTGKTGETKIDSSKFAYQTRFTLPDKITDEPVLSNKLNGDEINISLESNNLLKNTSNTTLQTDKVNQSVRISIPDLYGRTIHPSGQSIMIRIEPEHLGPAQLNISLRNDLLTARVVVESLPAKLAIESSLDQLTDQLSRVGVDLDKIEVSLSGGDTAHQFFDQRPNWQLSSRRGGFNQTLDDKTEITQDTPSRISMPSVAQTIDPDGVNLLV